jgi:hypothetical protein
MTPTAVDVKAAAGVNVLASEVSQDIWAWAWPHDPQHHDTSALFRWRPWCSARIHRTVRKHRRVQERSRSTHKRLTHGCHDPIRLSWTVFPT